MAGKWTSVLCSAWLRRFSRGKLAVALIVAFLLCLSLWKASSSPPPKFNEAHDLVPVVADGGELDFYTNPVPPLICGETLKDYVATFHKPSDGRIRDKWIPVEEALFNPLAPDLVQPHHPTIRRFSQYYGPVDRNFIRDWLGVRTEFGFDCFQTPRMNYYKLVPSRRIPCDQHCSVVNEGCRFAGGGLPVFDDEYPEMVDMLSAVERTEDDFVVIELGARYGTWGARALAAWRQKRGSKKALFIGVEAESFYYNWMRHHIAVNDMTSQSVLLHGLVGAAKGEYSLEKLLDAGNVDHISYLDLDIQGAEKGFLMNSNTTQLLHERVDAIHIGTHSVQIHEILRKHFDEMGWTKVIDFTYHPRYSTCDQKVDKAVQMDKSCWTYTPLGPVYVRDGLLSYVNNKRISVRPEDYDASINPVAPLDHI